MKVCALTCFAKLARMRNSGKEGCRRGEEGCRKGGMQERRDAGEEGCRRGWIQYKNGRIQIQ